MAWIKSLVSLALRLLRTNTGCCGVSYRQLDWVKLRPGLLYCNTNLWSFCKKSFLLDNVDEVENHDEAVTPLMPSIFQNLEVIETSNCGQIYYYRPQLSSSIMAHFQKGLKNILQKHPHDVVFLSALRTPVTRAFKGGLRGAHAEEMLSTVRRLLPSIC